MTLTEKITTWDILVTKIYFDVCTLCRPFDDQTFLRIRLETDALYLILHQIQYGEYEMVVSSIHLHEIMSIEEPIERNELLTLFKQFGTYPHSQRKARHERAAHLHSLSFGVGDAAHVACAKFRVDVFLSCDDRLVKKSQRSDVKIPTMNPVDFCRMEDLK